MSGSFDVCHRYITHINYWLVTKKTKMYNLRKFVKFTALKKFNALRQLI